MKLKRKYKYQLLTFDRKGCPVHHVFCSSFHELLKCLNDSAVQLCETFQAEWDGVSIKGKYEAVYSFLCRRVTRINNTVWGRE